MRNAGIFALALAVGAIDGSDVAAQHAADVAAVEQAALDYLDGFYEGDQGKLRRSVHPDVVKLGFFRPEDGEQYSESPMSFQQMLDFAANVAREGNHPPATAPKEVEVLEVMDKIAAARVTAWWGADYLHLAKYDGQWKILHVLWQSPTRASN